MKKFYLGKSFVKTSDTPQNQKANLKNVIEYIANKIQTFLLQPSPDTWKYFGGRQQQKLPLKKGTMSQYLKKQYNISGNENSYGNGYGKSIG